ncbi:MAG: CoA pyrophosphatase [Cyclobacteriaceae bacterium]
MKPILPNGDRFPPLDPLKARKGAVLILFYKMEDQWYFPLIQRPLYEGVHSGQVAFPGGRKEEQDIDLFETAIRESHEEIGTEVSKINVIGSLSDFFVAVSNHLVKPVVGFYEGVPNFKPDTREVESVIEVPLEQLLDTTFLKEKEIEAASGYKLRSPYFELQNKVVWGATAMMLSELVDILNERKQ